MQALRVTRAWVILEVTVLSQLTSVDYHRYSSPPKSLQAEFRYFPVYLRVDGLRVLISALWHIEALTETEPGKKYESTGNPQPPN